MSNIQNMSLEDIMGRAPLVATPKYIIQDPGFARYSWWIEAGSAPHSLFDE